MLRTLCVLSGLVLMAGGLVLGVVSVAALVPPPKRIIASSENAAPLAPEHAEPRHSLVVGTFVEAGTGKALTGMVASVSGHVTTDFEYSDDGAFTMRVRPGVDAFELSISGDFHDCRKFWVKLQSDCHDLGRIEFPRIARLCLAEVNPAYARLLPLDVPGAQPVALRTAGDASLVLPEGRWMLVRYQADDRGWRQLDPGRALAVAQPVVVAAYGHVKVVAPGPVEGSLSLHGSVRTHCASAPDRTFVRIARLDVDGTRPEVGICETDELGNFVLEGVVAGVYAAAISHEFASGDPNARCDCIVLAQDGTHTPIELTARLGPRHLAPPPDISRIVLDVTRGGVPVPGLRLRSNPGCSPPVLSPPGDEQGRILLDMPVAYATGLKLLHGDRVVADYCQQLSLERGSSCMLTLELKPAGAQDVSVTLDSNLEVELFKVNEVSGGPWRFGEPPRVVGNSALLPGALPGKYAWSATIKNKGKHFGTFEVVPGVQQYELPLPFLAISGPGVPWKLMERVGEVRLRTMQNGVVSREIALSRESWYNKRRIDLGWLRPGVYQLTTVGQVSLFAEFTAGEDEWQWIDYPATSSGWVARVTLLPAIESGIPDGSNLTIRLVNGQIGSTHQAPNYWSGRAILLHGVRPGTYDCTLATSSWEDFPLGRVVIDYAADGTTELVLPQVESAQLFTLDLPQPELCNLLFVRAVDDNNNGRWISVVPTLRRSYYGASIDRYEGLPECRLIRLGTSGLLQIDDIPQNTCRLEAWVPGFAPVEIPLVTSEIPVLRIRAASGP